MTQPLVAYNFDEVGTTVTNYGSAAAGDFSIATASVSRVTGHTGTGLRSTGATAAVLPNLGATDQRTVMAWLQFTGITSSWPIIFNVASLGSGGWGILYLDPNICVQARNSSTFVRPSVAWPVDGQPHHVAGTYDGVAVRLYLDGVLQGSPAALTAPLRIDTDPPALWSGTGAMASGYLDDLRLYNVALSVAEIQAAMATPVTAPVTPPPTPVEPSVPPVISTGQGWYALQSIFEQAVAVREADDETAPLACPNDGEPLSSDPEGNLRCPWDGWVWDGQPLRYR